MGFRPIPFTNTLLWFLFIPHSDGAEEDAANMILFNLAKRFPQCYVKNFEMATKKNEKITGTPPVELPPNFVSYDGTNDIRWNTRYAELVKYKEKHGDCKVYTKTDLGRWVCSQRSARASTAKNLSSKRIELLDNLGFLWSGLPDGRARPIPGGDPRQNRAIAAKLVYPDLTIREVLQLGGFQEEELNVVKDLKHTWRTGYVYYKDQIVKKVENYEIARKSGARLEIEKLVNILQGDDEDRFEQVFQENSVRLPDFLEAAEERKRHGVVEKPRARSAKRRRNEDTMDMISDEEHQPASKQPYRAEGVVEQEELPIPDEVHFQAQVAYEHNFANAQQVARDPWRSHGNYWK
mmetsp:Transcript_25653/g.46428  ORF Transcript_25653/g.46428 Transcript_25653/m.46428 type:complete len:350 (+) Transcript_25653:1240-2289(+)